MITDQNIALRLSNVTYAYGSRTVLHRLNLVVEKGSITALLGPSGEGKTTLLRLICGFENPDEGTIEVAGRTVFAPGMKPVPPESRGVVVVPQEGALFAHLSVGQNIAFGLQNRRSSQVRARVAELLEMVGLSGSEDRRPSELSGGMQHRVALARALAPSPSLIVMDEPFSALDAHLRDKVRDDVVSTLRLAGATAMWVTHDQEEALSSADSVAVMLGGKVVQHDIPEVLYRAPVSQAVGEFVGDAVILKGDMTTGSDSVQCALGTLPTVPLRNDDAALAGEVIVMVRPEQLSLAENGVAVNAFGKVVSSKFFGHDGMVEVKVGSGELVRMRLHSTLLPSVGDDVAIHVGGSVCVFPQTH